jgi:hypothetical protein
VGFWVSLPILSDIEAPLKLKVLLLVVIDKCGHSIVMTAGEHPRGGIFFLDYKETSVSFPDISVFTILLTALGVNGLLIRIGSIASLHITSVMEWSHNV